MTIADRIESTMAASIATGQGGFAPGKLAAALDYAVNPGGARIRPTILMSVAMAPGMTALQVMPSGPSAMAMDRIRPSMPALVAQ